MNKYFWNAWLRPNHLSQEVQNDQVAEVFSPGKTLTNADIARLFLETGPELQIETIQDVINRTDRIKKEKLQEGYTVQTGFSRMWASIASVRPPGSVPD